MVFSANDVDKMGLSACLRKGLDEIVAYFKDKFDVNLEANLKYSAQSGLKMKFNASKREKIDKFDENKLEQIGKFDENIVEKFDTKQTKSDSKICGRFDENLKYSAQSKLKMKFDTNSSVKQIIPNAKNAKFDEDLIEIYKNSSDLHFIYDGNTSFGNQQIFTCVKAENRSRKRGEYFGKSHARSRHRHLRRNRSTIWSRAQQRLRKQSSHKSYRRIWIPKFSPKKL